MEKINYKKEAVLWAMLLIPALYLAFVWNKLPEQVPIHFGVNGEPNGWAGKPAELIAIGLNIFVYLFTLFIGKIDPKAQKAGFFNSNFYKIRMALVVLLAAISMMVIYVGLPGHEDLSKRYLPAITFLLIAVIGNFMINIKPNWFLGIRTPWTLSSDAVWKKTHLVGGRIWFYGGLVFTVLALTINLSWLNGVGFIFILVSALFFFVYSFWLYKQEEANAGK